MARYSEPRPVPLYGGAYKSSSVIADAQRCVNLYMERAQSQQAPAPATHYLTPGLLALGAPDIPAGYRCLYRATNNELFAVVGKNVYYVSVTYQFTLLGTITDRLTNVAMADNGTDIMLVDGSSDGWTINLATHVLTQITDPAFYGSVNVDYLDGFFVLNKPGTRIFYISLFNDIAFDALDVVERTGGSDPIAAIWVISREAWIIGTQTTEIWYNAGDANFALAPVQGAFVDLGTIAPRSVARLGDKLFWLQQDKNGFGTIAMSEGYGAKKISTFGIDDEIQGYDLVSDAVGFCYQIKGHAFYQLTFPNEDVTWVYDLAMDEWHERASIDGNGVLHRHRASCGVYAYGKNIVGDFQNGILFSQEKDTYTDNGVPIVRLRSWPHFTKNGIMVEYQEFALDMAVGTQPSSIGGVDSEGPLISLRWSDTKGKSYGNAVTQGFGGAGEYGLQVNWNNLGQARDRVFELSWSGNHSAVLNQAYITAVPVE